MSKLRPAHAGAGGQQSKAVSDQTGARDYREIQVPGDTLMSTKYEIVLYWSEEDGVFIAEVPELPGCMADGKTRAVAIKNAEKVIAEWIETATELGRAIPLPRGKLMYA
jgi:predicted RNase H-like HicB family nuclease